VARGRTTRVERELFVRSFVPSARPRVGVISEVAELLEERVVPAGTQLYARGTPASHMFWVVEGKVELREEGRAPFTFGPRSTVGALDAFQGIPHTRDAIAVEDSILFRLDVERYLDVLEDNFEFLKGMIQFMFEGLEALSLSLGFEATYGPLRPAPSAEFGFGMQEKFGFIEGLLALRHDPLFRAIGVQVVVRLAQLGRFVERPRGAELWTPGERHDALLWLVAGQLEGQHREQPGWRGTFGALVDVDVEPVAPLVTLSNREPRYRLVAQSPVVLVEIPKESWFDVMEDHPSFMRGMLAFSAANRQRLMRLAADRGITPATT
jgi:CRP-like cAMP-binding protein